MIPNLKEEFERAELIETAPIEITPRYDEARSWYVLLTLPGQDRRAAEWMEKTKQAIYWPHYDKRVQRRSGQRTTRTCPIIPGYLFAAAALGRLPDYHRCDFIRGFLVNDGKAATVEERDIQAIRTIEGQLNLPPSNVEWTWQPAVGQRVRFTISEWNERTGVVNAIAGEGRIVVKVEAFGGTAPVTVSSSQIAPM